jgi:molybdopterin molybdotransferase
MDTIAKEQQIACYVQDAVQRLCAFVLLQPVESVKLEYAFDRILAKDVCSPFPMPSFRKAAMDGYVVKSADIHIANPEHPTRLRVLGEIKAGVSESNLRLITDWAVAQNQSYALRIFTGAPVPDELDTLVLQEAVVPLTNGNGEEWIEVTNASPSRKHIVQIGEDIAAGNVIIAKGTRIEAEKIALLAAFGLTEIEVYRKPIVAILPIGDELIKPGELFHPNQVYDLNSRLLEAKLQRLGALPLRLRPISDNLACISAAITESLNKADLLLTIGGISGGDYDYVRSAMNDAGGAPLFSKVLMRPGTPTSAFTIGAKLAISLSGNPSACYVGFELLVKPLLRKKMGCTDYLNLMVNGELTAGVMESSPYPRYIRSFASIECGKLYITPLPQDQSGIIAAFAQANALALIPAGGCGAAKGQMVRMQWIHS